jgi:hypothetical protein
MNQQEQNIMQEMTLTEMNEVSGGGTRIGTTASGGSNSAGITEPLGRAGGVIGNVTPTPLGGGVRVGSDGANN